jgi:hypothetical protein
MHAELEQALGVVNPDLGVHTAYFTVPTSNVAYVMSVLESYESIGVARSHDPAFAEGRVLMVAMLVPDFVAVAAEVLTELEEQADLAFVEATPERIAELRVVLSGARAIDDQ